MKYSKIVAGDRSPFFYKQHMIGKSKKTDKNSVKDVAVYILARELPIPMT
jgi:hypothetical protein